jgi:membrane-bound serine protease (ClpP class)
VVSVAVVTGLFFAFAVTKVAQAQRKPAVTGLEGLVGRLAQARTDLDPEGTVFIGGELWYARATGGPIQADEMVEVVAVDGFCLSVRKARPV